MIKLDHYKVRGFKNLMEADVSLNNVNVIIGPNNSGKSNFIQSISFLNYVINGSTDDLEKSFSNGFSGTHYRGIIPFRNLYLASDTHKHEDRVSFELRFSNTKSNNTFKYELELAYISDLFDEDSFSIYSESLEVKEIGKPGKATNVFSRKINMIKFGSELTKVSGLNELPGYLSTVRILKIMSGGPQFTDAANSLNTIIKTPTFYFSNTELLKAEALDRVNVFNGRTVSFDLEKEIIGLEQGTKWNIFCSAVKNILNISSVFIHTYTSNERLKKEERKVQKVLLFEHFGHMKRINQMSDGTILIIALVTKVLTSENDIFFIEEPENSIHPKALIDLFSFLQSFSESKQFVISSHSIALLNKTRIEDILTSCATENGDSEIKNVLDRKELKQRLKSSYVNFSDELFFGVGDKEEFE